MDDPVTAGLKAGLVIAILALGIGWALHEFVAVPQLTERCAQVCPELGEGYSLLHYYPEGDICICADEAGKPIKVW